MPEDLLTKIYYGNTVQEWMVALLVVFGSIILSRVMYWIFTQILRRYTSRTETRLDDMIIDMVEAPVTFIIVLLGIWYGLNMLNIPDSFRDWISGGLQFLIVLTIGWLLVRLFDAFHKEYLVAWVEKTDTELDEQLLPIISKATKTIIWVMAVIISLDNAGYDIGALLAGLGIGGLALAMAARDTVSNIFGGFTIFADRPFKLNDRVRIAGFDGFIREVGLRSTRLQTLDGTVVTMPNGKFTDTPVENMSMEPSRKVSVSLGLTYDTTPNQMKQGMEILEQIASQNPNLEEKVVIFFSGFGDFSMNLNFIYYIGKENNIPDTLSQVNMAILERFNAAGLEFAFPTQTLYTYSKAVT